MFLQHVLYVVKVCNFDPSDYLLYQNKEFAVFKLDQSLIFKKENNQGKHMNLNPLGVRPEFHSLSHEVVLTSLE